MQIGAQNDAYRYSSDESVCIYLPVIGFALLPLLLVPAAVDDTFYSIRLLFGYSYILNLDLCAAFGKLLAM